MARVVWRERKSTTPWAALLENQRVGRGEEEGTTVQL
jgi:hypothetical protein